MATARVELAAPTDLHFYADNAMHRMIRITSRHHSLNEILLEFSEVRLPTGLTYGRD